MSVACFSQVMRLRLQDPTEKLVLLAFAEHANEDGLTFPSVDLVAAEALCSNRTVQRIIKRFIESGLLRLHKRASGRGYPTCYRVDPWAIGPLAEYTELRDAQRRRSHPDLARAPSAPSDEDPQQSLLDEMGDTRVSPITPRDEPQKGDTDREKGDKSAEKGDTLMSSEPRTYNQKERAKARPVDNSLDGLPAAASHSHRSCSAGAGSSSLDPPHQRHHKTTATSHKQQQTTDYREPLECITEKARQHAITPRKKWENEHAFRNRVNVAVHMLAVCSNEARRLHIDNRRPDESATEFERRVTDQALRSEGMASDVTWQKARQQALDGD